MHRLYIYTELEFSYSAEISDHEHVASYIILWVYPSFSMHATIYLSPLTIIYIATQKGPTSALSHHIAIRIIL